MLLDMIKNFTVDDIRIEPDGSKTVLFTVKKSRVNPDNTITNRSMQSTFVVPAEYTDMDIDAELFKILERSGWI